MRTLDLRAPIIPRLSAAGFEIGMDISEIAEIIKSATVLDHEVTVAALRQNQGVIARRNQVGRIQSVFFRDDQVRLSFNAAGKLFCIFLFEGYSGTYLESISVGSPMSSVQRLHPLLYDDGDEMCYIADVEGNIVPGIAFAGSSCSLVDDPEQLVWGFCVHDWSIQK
ncbi:hypothetical protein GTP58_18935 [Duganella sp. CY15W]|uniref:hypothetical protein n=1 Tax=Duganella sp. CY15W TaxID=2692172 RepID=UPI00136CAADB|nr:hypothetical protein [Duganella sp. CY15W]MYM30411.1 hypothetical protein [Duganella sp. CY15W]